MNIYSVHACVAWHEGHQLARGINWQGALAMGTEDPR